jgi:sugar lactone lactonase YvrE
MVPVPDEADEDARRCVRERTIVFRKPSNYANGNTQDRRGRLVTCEHGARLLEQGTTPLNRIQKIVGLSRRNGTARLPALAREFDFLLKSIVEGAAKT